MATVYEKLRQYEIERGSAPQTNDHVDGFKDNINTELVDVGRFYREIKSIVKEKRLLDIFGLDFHCYECHKPIKIDGRDVYKNKKVTLKQVFCSSCHPKKPNYKLTKDPFYLKHKNHILSVFKNKMLGDSFNSLGDN